MLLVSHVLRCALPSWYAQLAHLTFRTEFLELPVEVVAYLRHKGSVVAPRECDHFWPATSQCDDNDDDDGGDDDGRLEDNENSEESEESEDEESSIDCPSFPLFTSKVASAIEQLGGCVMPKLNWSSPRDATWLSMDNSLRCENPLQVYLLLKASDFVAHDLTRPFEHCSDCRGEEGENVEYVLALREWQSELNAASEFRLFIRDGRLVAACQRDATHFNEHLVAEKADLGHDLQTFVTENELVDIIGLQSFVVDVVRVRRGVVKLVDVNPFGPSTDSILFHWHELESLEVDGDQSVHLRLITDAMGVQPNGLGQYAVPRDLVELSSAWAAASDAADATDALAALINTRPA